MRSIFYSRDFYFEHNVLDFASETVKTRRSAVLCNFYYRDFCSEYYVLNFASQNHKNSRLPSSLFKSSALACLNLCSFSLIWFVLILVPLVEMRRIELLTPCLQSRCSPSWATPPRLWRYSFLCLHPQNQTITTSFSLALTGDFFFHSP